MASASSLTIDGTKGTKIYTKQLKKPAKPKSNKEDIVHILHLNPQ